MADQMTTWSEAYDANRAAVEAHPLFPRLVREVAVAEQPTSHTWHHRYRNSRTGGSWMLRGMPHTRPGSLRAYHFAVIVGIDVMPTAWPRNERVGFAYAIALQHVRARSNGGRR